MTDIDEKELDAIYRTVAAMKQFGIYTIISPFFPNHAKIKKSWGIADSGSAYLHGIALLRSCATARL